ncbi:hypothetical protein V1478_000198 [Vespula squamosa]|uniref:Uncharacterized protein n=1 Tax=Vespula squamosa TaxID=30214 RepID=A0ABD2C4U2_VESSQ
MLGKFRVAVVYDVSERLSRRKKQSGALRAQLFHRQLAGGCKIVRSKHPFSPRCHDAVAARGLRFRPSVENPDILHFPLLLSYPKFC